jgi:hypothetical protein
MIRDFCTSISLALVAEAIPLRAAKSRTQEWTARSCWFRPTTISQRVEYQQIANFRSGNLT